jgi:CheY-specific phosphatase CheX
LINNEITIFQNITDYFKVAFEEISFKLIKEKLNSTNNTSSDKIDTLLTAPTENNVFVLIGITGSYSGRLVLSANTDTVDNFVREMNAGIPVDSEESGNYFAEFANMICGKALSSVNNTTDNIKLWLSPPAVLSGTGMEIISLGLHAEEIYYTGNTGKIILNIGLKKGD